MTISTHDLPLPPGHGSTRMALLQQSLPSQFKCVQEVDNGPGGYMRGAGALVCRGFLNGGVPRPAGAPHNKVRQPRCANKCCGGGEAWPAGRQVRAHWGLPPFATHPTTKPPTHSATQPTHVPNSARLVLQPTNQPVRRSGLAPVGNAQPTYMPCSACPILEPTNPTCPTIVFTPVATKPSIHQPSNVIRQTPMYATRGFKAGACTVHRTADRCAALSSMLHASGITSRHVSHKCGFISVAIMRLIQRRKHPARPFAATRPAKTLRAI
eukprot:365374-Chlamydomonas_euryale.AAC.5